MTMYTVWKSSGKLGGSHGRLSLESVALEEDLVNEVTGEVVGDASDEIPAMVQEAEEIGAQVDHAQQAVAAADQGELVADIGESIQQRGTPATMEEAALIQAGVANTLQAQGAGTDDIQSAVSDVATESSGGYYIAMEGFKETLKRIWQGIKDFFARIWQGMKNMFNRMWNSTASVLKRAEKLKKELDDKKDEYSVSGGKLELSTGVFKALSSTKSGKFEYDSILKTFEKHYADKNFSKDSVKIVETLIKSLEERVKKHAENISNKKDDLLDIKKAVEEAIASACKGLTNDGETVDVSRHFSRDYDVDGTAFPFGNKAVAGVSYSVKNATFAETLNHMQVKIVEVHSTWKPVGTKALEVSKLYSLADLKKIPSLVEDCVKGLEDFYNKDSKRLDDDIQKFRKTIDEQTEKVDESWDAAAKSNIRDFQRTFMVPTTFLRSIMDTCVHVIRTVNSLVTMGFEHSKKLKSKDDKK